MTSSPTESTTPKPKQPDTMGSLIASELERLQTKRRVARAALQEEAADRIRREALADPLRGWCFAFLQAGELVCSPERYLFQQVGYVEIPSHILAQHLRATVGPRAKFDEAAKALRQWIDRSHLTHKRKQVSPGKRVRSYVFGPLPALRASFTAATGIQFAPGSVTGEATPPFSNTNPVQE